VLATVPASGAGSDPSPSRLLPAAAHGHAALQALGPDLGLAAQRNEMAVSRLRQLLTTDSSAWVDRTGQLYYVDREEITVETSATAPTSEAAYAYADTFLLHSRPNATRKIFLDFDGHQVTGTAWNNAANPVIDVAPYSKDTNPAFSRSEMDVIQEVWARIAEDYAVYNIDVTTQDPGTAGLLRTATEDAEYGMRAAITTDMGLRDILCGGGGGCAGKAYVGAFNRVSSNGFYHPAFGMPTATASATEVAGIVSHEIGHSLGLNHDGLYTSAYYWDATGGKIWSPTMGAAFTPLNQFSNGDYAGATETQDDLAVMAQHGPTLLSDDYGDTPATARAVGAGDVTVKGLISSRTDRDVFAVTRTCTGTLSATLTPAALGPDLDTTLRLLDASGSALAFSNPPTARSGSVLTGMDSAVAKSVSPGTYYLEVDGTGLDDPTLGYSDYGSVGRYSLAVDGCQSTRAVTTPSAPIIEAVEPDSVAKGLRLVWDEPADNGGAAVTSYVVRVGGQQVSVGAATNTLVVTPLAPNTTYALEVAAVNSAGTGPAASRTATTGSFAGTPSTSTPTTTTATPTPTATTTTATPTPTATTTTATPTPTATTTTATPTPTATTTTATPTPTATTTTATPTPTATAPTATATATTTAPTATATATVTVTSSPTTATPTVTATTSTATATATPTATPTATSTTTPTTSPTVTWTPTVSPTPTTSTPTATPTPTDVPTTYHVPGKPRRLDVTRGKPGGPLTLRLSWRAPSVTGGAPVSGYVVAVFQQRADGRLARVATRVLPAKSRHLRLALAPGRYRLSVAAENVAGEGAHTARTPWRRPR
jgi:hypothetical protein